MKSVGLVIKEARTKKKLSKDALEAKTKIKSEYIEALENELWEKLPEYPVVVGFVKSIAAVLSLDESHALALLRRDYPPKVLPVNPKPDVDRKFTWDPRLTFITAVFVVSLGILTYLSFQYIHFTNPPELAVETPIEGQVITEKKVAVKGKTDPEATVTVNNQPTLVGDDGAFTAEIEIAEATDGILITAKSRSGKETKIMRKIRVELK